MKSLEDGAFASKRVLVRIDGDVPLTGDHPPQVADDFRLLKLLPTIFYLQNHRAKIILCAHLGRPGGKIVPSLSLKPVFLHLSALINKKIHFAADPFGSATNEFLSKMSEGEIVGLENLRYFKGEEDSSRTFARKLANLADIYVNDAFAAAHSAASTVTITEFLPSYAGLQLEKEIQLLTSLTRSPARPFIAVIGGAKTADKMGAIAKLLPLVDRILVGGRVANTFMASQGLNVGRSEVEPALVKEARQLLKTAKGKIIMPTDLLWGNDQTLDIGPNSTQNFISYLKTAKTILWSGVPGKVEDPKYAKASAAIARAMAKSPATTIVGGGDTVAFIDSLGLNHKYSFVSTGGSAMLELLGGRTLPTISALNR